MRLDPEQIQAIHQVLRRYFKEKSYSLYLYGSRVRDDLKGGDIDLLILSDAEGVNLFKQFCLDILVDIKAAESIGQRRIDLKAATEHDLDTDPFWGVVRPQLLKL